MEVCAEMPNYRIGDRCFPLEAVQVYPCCRDNSGQTCLEHDPQMVSGIKVVWREIYNPDLYRYWNSTHQGFECEPPKRMWYSFIDSCAEMWVFEEEPDYFTISVRTRLRPGDWWLAVRSFRSDAPNSWESLAEAQDEAVRILNRDKLL